MTIRRLAPRHCPECDAEGTLFINDQQQISCRLCGYVEQSTETEDTTQTPAETSPHKQYRITYGLMYSGTVDPWTRSIYDSGLAALHRDDVENALKSFRRAAESQADFTDAHLWVARLSDDEAEKREHYGVVLAYHPHNQMVVRELMILNGQLDSAGAARTANMAAEPEVIASALPVGTKVKDVACPTCGGVLTVIDDGLTAKCHFCGQTQSLVKDGDHYGIKNLTVALIEQRAKGPRWEVGKRLLHCNNCGAERVLNARELNTRCPFCASVQVVEQDAVESFMEPDGVVPFRIKPEQALSAIDAAVNSRKERFKGLFVNNTVVRRDLKSAFLPYWYFDAGVLVTKTTIDRSDSRNTGVSFGFDHQGNFASSNNLVTTDKFTDHVHDVPCAGFKSPRPGLVRRLGRFDLSRIVPYKPVLLEKHTAELPTINFDRASILVRSDISARMRDKHQLDTPFDNREVRISSMVQQMSFRLVLVPIYIINLLEADGDIRVGIIHGQTGKATLGKAFKPQG